MKALDLSHLKQKKSAIMKHSVNTVIPVRVVWKITPKLRSQNNSRNGKSTSATSKNTRAA